MTFAEAATEAHITSGEKLSVMFGKILKMFKGKAPNSHASSGTTYGVGTTTNYGHCKTINGLTQSSHVNGNALSAYQGKLLKDLIDGLTPGSPLIYEGVFSYAYQDPPVAICSFDIRKYRGFYLAASYTALYTIVNNNRIVGAYRSSTTSGAVGITTHTLSSADTEVTYMRSDSSGDNHYYFLLKVSGNTATLSLKGNSNMSNRAYTAIIF